MPRRKNKTMKGVMKGGFWDKITDMFKKKPTTPIGSTSYTPTNTTIKPTTPTTPITPITPSTTTTSTPSTTTTSTPSTTLTSSGGRRTRRRYRGGYAPNHSLTNLASKAAPFSGSKTAQPQVWLGGPKMMGGKGKSRKLRKSKRRYRK
jgi:hypothetical protein